MSFHRSIFQVHLWCGLIVGIFVVVQSLTGSLDSFRPQANRLLHGGELVVAWGSGKASFSDMLGSVERHFPDYEFQRAELSGHGDQAILFRLGVPGGSTPYFVFVNPYTGQITGSGPLSAYPFQLASAFHTDLLSGTTGFYTVGGLGVLLLLMALTGVYLWWPVDRRFKRALTINWHGSLPSVLYDLHKFVGFSASIVLVVIAFSGALLCFQEFLRPAINVVARAEARPRPNVPEQAGRPVMDLDGLITIAQREFPQDSLSYVVFPGGHGRVVYLLFSDSDNVQPRALNRVWLNAYNGNVLARIDAALEGNGTGFIYWMLPVHSGEFLGMAGRILVFVSGFAPLLLFVTGTWLWWAKRRRCRG